MNSADPSPSTPWSVRLVPLAEVVGLDCWAEGLRFLAKDHRYYEIVAETLGFDSRALLVEDATGRAVAAQPCFFVVQDLVATTPGWVQSMVGAVRWGFPRFLRLKMLMIGNAAGEGHLAGPIAQAPEMIRAIHRAALEALAGERATLLVWKDFPVRYRAALRGLSTPSRQPGAVPLASMPATRLALDFTSFEEYLIRLSPATRKSLRRKFRTLADVPPIEMTVTTDLGEAIDEALALYEQVFARAKLKFEHLTRAFLQRLAATFHDRVRFFLWRQEGRLVAFSLCLVHDGVLSDEYLGLDYRVALDLHLYYVTFRDLVSWALTQGLTTYYSTPLSYEPKRRLGFDLAPLDLHLAPRWPHVDRRALPVLRSLSPTHSEPILGTFPNAHDLDPVAENGKGGTPNTQHPTPNIQ